MSTLVFGVEIELNDAASPVLEDEDIGLYNGDVWTLQADAVNGDSDLLLNGNTAVRDLYVGNRVYLSDDDDNPNETCTIKAIYTSGGNTYVKLTAPIQYDYAVADGAFVRANSRFRWLQNSVSGVTGWNSTMMADAGISPIVREAEMPGLALPGSCGVAVTNTARFHNELFTRGVYFNGRQFRVFSFSGTTPTIVWTGWCEQPEWTAESYYIPAIGGSIKHRANILTVINPTGYPNADNEILGRAIPASLGVFKPKYKPGAVPYDVDYTSYAKFVRTANSRAFFNNTTLKDMGLDITPDNETAFPVVAPKTADGTAPRLTFTVGFSYMKPGAIPTYPSLNGYYLQSIEGQQEKAIRKIENTSYTTTYVAELSDYLLTGTVDISDYYEGNLFGNTQAIDDNQTWTNILDLQREYSADAWPCYGYITEDGVEVTLPELYGFILSTDDGDFRYSRIADSAYVDNTASNNVLSIDPKHCTGTMDTIDSFVFYTPTSFNLLTAQNLSNWADSGDVWVKRTDGVYAGAAEYGNKIVTGVTDNVLDKDPDTSYGVQSFIGAVGQASVGFVAFLFGFPKWEPNTHFDDVYICLRTLSQYEQGTKSHVVSVRYRKWIGAAESLAATAFPLSLPWSGIGDPVNCRIFSLPDWYFDPAQETKNRDFYTQDAYYVQSAAGFPDGYYTDPGYKTFKIADIDTTEKLNSISEYGLFFFHQSDISQVITTDHIYNIALALKTTLDIKNAIYSPFRGRTYNSTWGTRKPTADPIATIVDMLEHVCRLQCWSECSAMPTGGWGKGYSEGARINVGTAYVSGSPASGQKDVTVAAGAGSNFRENQFVRIFDSAASEENVIASVTGDVLTMQNNLAATYGASGTAYVDSDGSYDSYDLDALVSATHNKICNQIQVYEDGWTDRVKLSICRDYGLLSWVDKYGFECVKKIKKSDRTTQDTVTMSDIVDRSRVRVMEPAPESLYPEPLLQYQKDFGKNETQKTIAIRGAGAAAYDSSYVDGVSGFLAEEYWDRCQTVWGYNREITEPPRWWSNLSWVNGANADNIAQEILGDRIDWMMNPRIEIPLHYNKAGGWEEGHTFTLTLPHQTANVAIDCIVSRVSVNLNAPYDVLVTAYMWRETIPEDYNIVDTLRVYGDDRDWNDNTTEYGTDADKTDNMI